MIKEAHPNYVFHLLGKLGGAEIRRTDLMKDLASHGIKGGVAYSLLLHMQENKIIQVSGKFGAERIGLSPEYMDLYRSIRE
ncbi:MAG: hypothetical protein KGH82_00470 [Candidatus Micrarchaeota archaeon]|nr:hypothetical protein [Candidatus Micrarchaeota archaeon]